MLSLGFNPAQLTGAKGFTRIAALADAVEAVYTSDEVKRRFEILARQVFVRFKALLMEPSAFVYAERHDNLEAIYKKLADRERLKEASRDLLAALRKLIAPLDQWTRKAQTQAEVEVFILDHLYPLLPSPPFSEQDKTEAAKRVYGFVWQQTASGQLSAGLP